MFIIFAIITTITFCASRCLLLNCASLFPHSLLVPPLSTVDALTSWRWLWLRLLALLFSLPLQTQGRQRLRVLAVLLSLQCSRWRLLTVALSKAR